MWPFNSLRHGLKLSSLLLSYGPTVATNDKMTFIFFDLPPHHLLPLYLLLLHSESLHFLLLQPESSILGFLHTDELGLRKTIIFLLFYYFGKLSGRHMKIMGWYLLNDFILLNFRFLIVITATRIIVDRKWHLSLSKGTRDDHLWHHLYDTFIIFTDWAQIKGFFRHNSGNCLL